MNRYHASVVVAACGLILIAFGILSATDAGTVGGVIFGAMFAGAGILLAIDVYRLRRRTLAATRLNLERATDRDLTRLRQSRDRSDEHRAPRSIDREDHP